MRVRFSPEALADLEDIGDSTAKDSPIAAGRLVNRLWHRCMDIGNMPLAFPLVPGREAKGLRRRPFDRYLVFYSADDTHGVTIARVFHSARDYDSLLFPED